MEIITAAAAHEIAINVLENQMKVKAEETMKAILEKATAGQQNHTCYYPQHWCEKQKRNFEKWLIDLGYDIEARSNQVNIEW